MARYDKATWRPLSDNATEPPIIPIGVIWHSAASKAWTLWGFFQFNSNLESHFYIRVDGTVEQYMDTEKCADANYKANIFTGADGRRYGFISVETQNTSDDHDSDRFTPAQVRAMVELFDWAVDTHGILRRWCPTPFSGGFGYHTLFGAPSAWTPVSKSCAGRARNIQLRDEIAPLLIHPTAPPQEAVDFMEALMAVLSDEEIVDFYWSTKEIQNHVVKPDRKKAPADMGGIERLLASNARIEKALAALAEDVEAIEDRVADLESR
jgi:hypothetical protein